MIAAHMPTTGSDTGAVALFTNPQGVWNKFSGTWDVPKGRQWNGKFWAKTARKERKTNADSSTKPGASSASGRADKKVKVMQAAATPDSSDDDSEAGPPPKKSKPSPG